MTKEAMQQALEALEVEQIEVQLFRLVPKPHLTNAITVLREALNASLAQRQSRSADTWVNATTWRGLTDEEFESIEKATLNVHGIPKYFGTAIEAKLKEKNT